VTADRCTWCGTDVDADAGFRAYEPAGSRRAVFCRLEHIVPWGIHGAWWEPAPDGAGAPAVAGLEACAHCGEPLGDAPIALVRTRGEHLIPDGFCSVGHLLAWAKAGGRWRG
jgi:hypothetical protein